MSKPNENLRIEQQTRLQQRLNPQQVVFGRYLEMTAPEIEEEVRRALDENPALEAVGEPGDSRGEDDAHDDFDESAEQLQRADYGDDDDVPVYGHTGGYDPDAAGSDMPVVDDEVTLMDSLTSQLADIDLDDRERKIAEYIIGNLDDNGYITRSLADIADDVTIAEGITVGLKEVKEVFSKIRHLDPAGIGAVDLRDCLLLQIDRYPKTLTTKIAREIIADWFDMFSKKHFDQLRSHLGIDNEQMHAALDFIRGLNPKPGSLVEGSSASDKLRHIVPDFAVDVDGEGHAHVSLLNNIPELAIEESFRTDGVDGQLSRRESDAQAFIKRRREDATAFIDMLKMRSDTLFAVMKAIVKIQHRFFATDDKSTIRPMIIRDIAAETGLNISVISRAAAGKYVLTPHGLYPLKMFFNERPKDDADTSSHEILDALSKIIGEEDKKHPLSDEALCERLAAQGYDIARRTVTKYRERLGQPVARLRRQF